MRQRDLAQVLVELAELGDVLVQAGPVLLVLGEDVALFVQPRGVGLVGDVGDDEDGLGHLVHLLGLGGPVGGGCGSHGLAAGAHDGGGVLQLLVALDPRLGGGQIVLGGLFRFIYRLAIRFVVAPALRRSAKFFINPSMLSVTPFQFSALPSSMYFLE